MKSLLSLTIFVSFVLSSFIQGQTMKELEDGLAQESQVDRQPLSYLPQLDEAELRRKVQEKAKRTKLVKCYEDKLPYNRIGAEIKLSWDITEKGRVKYLSIDSFKTLKKTKRRIAVKRTKIKKFKKCVFDKVKRWKFKKPKDGRTIAMKYPFTFS